MGINAIGEGIRTEDGAQPAPNDVVVHRGDLLAMLQLLQQSRQHSPTCRAMSSSGQQ